MNERIGEERLAHFAGMAVVGSSHPSARELDERRLMAIELQETRKELAEMRTYSHETVRGLVDHRDKEIAELRASHAELMKALDGLMNLFRDPSPFYIKKLGSPITNGDQDKIDDAFLTAHNVLLAAKKVTA